MKLLCIGDSLTFGNLGYSYRHFLPDDIRTLNRGKNGDTVFGALSRLKRMRNGETFRQVHAVVLSIGTNDMLLPYLREVSPFWHLQMLFRCRFKRCVEDDELFRAEYEKFFTLLAPSRKRVLVVGLPEVELENYPEERLRNRNRILRELSEKHGADFIDIRECQEEIPGEKAAYSWRGTYPIRIFDTLVMTLFPFTKDRFSSFRKLRLTVDGVHFNSASARLLAEEIDARLKERTERIGRANLL